MAKRRLPPGVKIVNGRPVFSPFTPAVQQPIPPTMYDPALDATLGQAKRGFNDLFLQDQTQGQRMITDYGLRGEAITRDQTRGEQDLQRQESVLNRNYEQLAGAQRQQMGAYGVLQGGAALQAARKRAANRAFDQQPIDTSRTRLNENTDLARADLNLNYAPPDAANPLGGRAWQDMGTQLGIAGRELGYTGIDTEKAKAFQAAQLGYAAPPKPFHEQTNPLTGGTTREYKINGFVYTVGKGGKILKRRKA